MIDLYSLSIIAFIIILAIIVYKDRKKIEFKYILLMRRTKRFRTFIDKIAKISPRFWKAFSTLGVLVAFYFMIQGVYILSIVSYDVLTGVIDKPGFQFVLPTPGTTAVSGPGYILIPFWFWVITIAVILIPHELFHGIIARAEKIRLRSVGLLLLAVLPGAFVEPDEKQLLKKSGLITKLRVFAAGSFANFIVAMIIFLLTSLLVWPLAVGPGVTILEVNESSPVDTVGLEPGMILTEINGKNITTSYQEYISGQGYFAEEVGFVTPNQTVTLSTEENSYNVTILFDESTNKSYTGMVYLPVFKVNEEFFVGVTMPLLTMLWLFSFAVGLFNILPIYPLDGGQIVKAITDKFAKRRSQQITRMITYLMLLILIFIFVGPLSI